MFSGKLFDCKKIGIFFDEKVDCGQLEFDEKDLETEGSVSHGIFEDYPNTKYVQVKDCGSFKKITIYEPSLQNYFLNMIKYKGPTIFPRGEDYYVRVARENLYVQRRKIFKAKMEKPNR